MGILSPVTRAARRSARENFLGRGGMTSVIVFTFRRGVSKGGKPDGSAVRTTGAPKPTATARKSAQPLTAMLHPEADPIELATRGSGGVFFNDRPPLHQPP